MSEIHLRPYTSTKAQPYKLKFRCQKTTIVDFVVATESDHPQAKAYFIPEFNNNSKYWHWKVQILDFFQSTHCTARCVQHTLSWQWSSVQVNNDQHESSDS